ncbi:MAG: hypothetical protein GXP55_18490 [Deltaproteobacteria bacterium]|nr:hypothetical protein [Deltaproteobacteria bacterium]
MRLRHLSLLFPILAACGGDVGQGEAPPLPLAEPAPTHELRRAGSELFDAQGRLRESNQELAALKLPVGLEQEYVDRRVHAFHTVVPLRKVLQYFGPRLITGQVDTQGESATYRAALPRDARGSQVRLDVTIAPSSRGGTSIRIYELPSEPVNPPSLEELRREFESDPNNLM